MKDASFNKTDKLQLGEDIASNQLWFSRNEGDLLIQILGGDDSVRIENWYTDQKQKVEQLVLDDGSILLDNEVEKLVSAMATLNAPDQGELYIPDELQLIGYI